MTDQPQPLIDADGSLVAGKRGKQLTIMQKLITDTPSSPAIPSCSGCR